MQSYLISSHFDLISPDGKIVKIKKQNATKMRVEILIKNISSAFLGFHTDQKHTIFNLKSTLAQVGINSKQIAITLHKKKREAVLDIELTGISELGNEMLQYISLNDYVGKLFTEEKDRKVRDPYYLERMLNRKDRNGHHLLYFGTEKLDLQKKDGYTVAYLPIKKGVIEYTHQIHNFLPALSKIISQKNIVSRDLLKLYQKVNMKKKALVKKNELLLVKTDNLYVRTAFAKVAQEYLPKNIYHTAACILQPDTFASGNIYEFFGNSNQELTHIPLEFYTLEAHREFVFFEDRDQLKSFIEDPKILFNAFETAPKGNKLASMFIIKGHQLKNLKKSDWIVKNPKKNEFPYFKDPEKQSSLVQKYITEQSAYPFLKAIEDNLITSQGILFSLNN